MNLTNQTMQSIGMRERNDRSVLQNGRIYVFRFVDVTTRREKTITYLYTCDSMSAESTGEIPSEFSRQFTMPYRI